MRTDKLAFASRITLASKGRIAEHPVKPKPYKPQLPIWSLAERDPEPKTLMLLDYLVSDLGSRAPLVLRGGCVIFVALPRCWLKTRLSPTWTSKDGKTVPVYGKGMCRAFPKSQYTCKKEYRNLVSIFLFWEPTVRSSR